MKGDLEILKHQKELFVAQWRPKTQLFAYKTLIVVLVQVLLQMLLTIWKIMEATML